jgi:hypothetical protein
VERVEALTDVSQRDKPEMKAKEANCVKGSMVYLDPFTRRQHESTLTASTWQAKRESTLLLPKGRV